MDTITVGRLPSGLFVCKGQVWKSLDDLDKNIQMFWNGQPMLVRTATQEETAYWLESIRNKTAKIF